MVQRQLVLLIQSSSNRHLSGFHLVLWWIHHSPFSFSQAAGLCIVIFASLAQILPLLILTTLYQGDQPWDFFGRNDAKAETPVLWPPHAKSWLIGKDWCWEGLGAGGEGDDRGWDGWMASLTLWTWVWVHFGSWWWTGRPGVLRFMGLQRVGHDWGTELNWTEGTFATL